MKVTHWRCSQVAGRRVELGQFSVPRVSVESLGPAPGGGHGVRVTLHDVVDVYRRERTTTVVRDVALQVRHQHFAEDIRAQILELIAHELDEWLRVDGRRVRDPHPRETERQALQVLVDDFDPPRVEVEPPSFELALPEFGPLKFSWEE